MTREELSLARKSLPRLSRLILDEIGIEGTDLLLRMLDDTEHYVNHRIVRILQAGGIDVSVWQVKVWREVGLYYPPALIPELQQLRERIRGSTLRLIHHKPVAAERRTA